MSSVVIITYLQADESSIYTFGTLQMDQQGGWSYCTCTQVPPFEFNCALLPCFLKLADIHNNNLHKI